MNTSRWLSEDEQLTWLSYLRATKLLNDRLDNDLQTQFHISLDEYEVLAMLSTETHGLRMSSLAEITVSPKSRLTHCVTRLQQQGYVERVSCPTDKRGTFAVLTAKGTALLKRAAPVHVDGVRTAFTDQMNDAQRRSLTKVMGNIVQSAEIRQ